MMMMMMMGQLTALIVQYLSLDERLPRSMRQDYAVASIVADRNFYET